MSTRVALVAWLRFCIETEEFDRSLPGFFFRGTDDWIPIGEGRHRSLAFARNRRAQLQQELSLSGVPTEHSMSAKREAEAMKHTERVELLARLTRPPTCGGLMHREQWVARPCPMCGKPDSARMGNSRWGHNDSCCSDACGFAYADSEQRAKREVERAELELAVATQRLRDARAKLDAKGRAARDRDATTKKGATK